MQLSQKRDLDAPEIPDRLYFKIGDVARICGVETYVLRFWETQFPQLKPNKSGTGQRLYRRRDVEFAVKIKQLVHTEGYTLAGARQLLEQGNRRASARPALVEISQLDSQDSLPMRSASADLNPTQNSVAATIAFARAELREIAALLASPEPNLPAQTPRRRARLATMPSKSEFLFPLA
ncbi:MAG: MerR family transcriptional regulator [Terracidiphilus sp.]